MLKYTLFTLLIIVSACGANNTPEPGLIFSANQLELANENQKDQGSGFYAEIHAATFNYSNTIFIKKVNIVLDAANKIEYESAQLNKYIEKLKTELFKQLKENMNPSSSHSIINKPFSNKNPLECSRYALEKVKSTGSSKIMANSALKLQKAFQNFRRSVCEIVVESEFIRKDSKKYFFKDPNINQFKTEKELYELTDKALTSSNVNSEYREILIELYSSLTHTEDFWNNKLTNNTSWISDYLTLLSLQNELLAGRTLSLRMLDLRIGHCCYSFSSVEPMVIGPEVARENETVYLDVFMAAFNQFQDPEIEIEGGATLLYIRDGKARIKVNSITGSELTIKGKISIRKNSGDISVKNWQKTIIVLPEDEKSKSIYGKTQKNKKN